MKTFRILLMVILSIGLLCGCGNARRRAENQAKLEQQQQLIEAASTVCAGTGHAEAAAYSQTADMHPVVMLSAKSSGSGWFIPTTDIPETWTPTQPQAMELVACITTEKALVETCPYQLTGGATASIERVQYHVAVTVYEAQSGKELAATVMDGSMPNNCGEQVSFKEGETKQTYYGSLPSTADIVAWLRPHVEGQ
jgi:hypothetical protein